MASVFVGFITLLLCDTAWTAGSATAVNPKPSLSIPNPRTKISRGVYATEVTGPIIYESLSAITFEFQLPEWLPQKTMMYDQTCETSEFSEDNPASTFTCPIYHHLHKVRDELEPMIQLSDLGFQPSSTKSSLDMGDCETLDPHFLSLSVTREVLDSYVKQLSKCLDGRVVHNLGVSVYNQSNIRLPYALMMNNFVENYFQNLPSEGKMDLATLLTAATGFNNLGFIQQLAEAQRWRSAVLDCKMRMIPTSLISPTMMQTSLQRLNETLHGQQKELAIPLEASTTSEYYREKLTDCVFTDQSLFVRTLLPTRRPARVWQLVSVRSVPFKLEENGTGWICRVKEFDRPKTFLFDPFSKDVFPHNCDIENTRFCRVRTDAAEIGDYKRSCASVVLSGENRRSRLSRFCELLCEPVEDFHTPVFTRVAADKFLIAGNPEETVVAQVDSQVNLIHPVEKGALEVILPCRGVLLYENRKISVREPCGKTYKIMRVHPVHW